MSYKNSNGKLENDGRKILLTRLDKIIAKTRLSQSSTTILASPEYLTALGLKLEALFVVNKIYRDGNLTAKKLAGILNTNTTYLSFLINTNYQSSIPQYITNYRINEAKTLLSDPEFNKITIEGLGTLCGFNSKSSFNRAFLAEVGMTPQEYKNYKQQV